MTRNILFDLIKNSAKSAKYTHCKAIVDATNRKGQAYYRFELKNCSPISFYYNQQHFFLIDHHLSVYATKNSYNPFLSDYHYTVYFKTEEKKCHQLHVYFTYNEQLATDPVFAVKHDKGYCRLNSKELDSWFIDLSKRYTQPIVSELKSQLTDEVLFLKQFYIQLQMKAFHLAKNHVKNHALYFSILVNIESTLKKLMLLTDHNDDLPLQLISSSPLIAPEKISVTNLLATANKIRFFQSPQLSTFSNYEQATLSI